MQYTSLLPVLCVALAVAGGCAPGADRATSPGSNAPEATPSDTASREAPSPVGDSSRMGNPPDPESLAPGTARVTVAANSCARRTSTDDYRCTLRVAQVRGYGPATPMLSAGARVQALLPTRLLTDATRPVFLEAQGTTDALLRHRGEGPSPSSGDDAPDLPAWSVARLF